MCFRWKWREQVIKQRDFAGHEKDSDDASALYRFFLLPPPLPQYIDLFGKGREKRISFSFFSFIIGGVVDDVLLVWWVLRRGGGNSDPRSNLLLELLI
ncbi:hypothetical protein TNIN_444841 [Trichonephila inaurata madagascariensis]|uniref:Uncharacterized protein n=1 Tax=Trichonephila inaurata madagascariensis TaxID=2747483 RepID=A0A8X6YXD6_9ARAC|nr:hypothetical protein TNIN_444841 [Trichonephila inaurata madagascariensis]